MATHSSVLAWRIPRTKEPGRLQSIGSQRVRHDWATLMHSLNSNVYEIYYMHFSLSCIREGNGNPLQFSCLENPRDRGAWWAAVHGDAQSQTRLKRLSSSSSSSSSRPPDGHRLYNYGIISSPTTSHFIDTIFCYLFLAFLCQNLICSLIPIHLSYFAQGC